MPRKKILLLLITLMAIYLYSNATPIDSSTISLNLNNEPLESAFTAIKKQTSYRVMYDNGILEQAKRVTIKVNNQELLSVLPTLFQSQPFDYKVMERTIVVTPKASASPYSTKPDEKIQYPLKDTVIDGLVMADSTGSPLEGALITVKASGTKTVTDVNGGFHISVPITGSVLLFSYIGYLDKSITVSSKFSNPLKIFLTPAIMQMQEVSVSTGYQIIPKERSTGSFTHLNNTVLNQQAGSNIINRLNGVANAVLFDNNPGRPAITIRGLSTIEGPKSPLIVVDNFPYEGDINNINPNDVEDVTILKDAAATSIWGTRAGNGVIVITTKKAGFNQKTKLEFTSNISIVDEPNLTELRPIASSDMIDVELMLFKNGYYDANINSINRPALSPVVELLVARRNGKITSADSASKIDALRRVDVRNDYSKYVYQKAVNQQYALNLRGGSDKVAYLFSIGYDRNISELSSKYDRLNIRSSNTFKPFKQLQIITSFVFTNSNTGNGRTGYGSELMNGTQRLVPYAQLADAAGNPVALAKMRQGYIDTIGQGKLLDWKYYPLNEYQYAKSTGQLQDLLANIAVQYSFFKNFNLDIRYQYQRQQSLTDNLSEEESYTSRSLINSYSQINYNSGTVTYIIPNGGILDKSTSTIASHGLRGQLNFNWSRGKSAVTAIAGSEIRQIRNYGNSYRLYGYNGDNLTAQNVDFVNTYPNIITGSASAIPNGIDNSDRNNRFVSFYANAAYTFNGKYTLTASGRKDASNLFGVNTNDKWKPLWSGGAAWNISQEKFYRSELLPYLRAKLTYGFSGNVDPSKSAVPIISYTSPATYTNYQRATITQFANPDLRWETVRTINFGTDFRSKADFLSGSIEYYIKQGYDLLGISPIDYTAGLNTYQVAKNVAAMKANGLDISLSFRNLNQAFKWNTVLQFNYNTSRITQYYLNYSAGSNFVGNGSVIGGLVGRPVYSLFSYQWRGLDASGNPKGVFGGQTSTNYTGITGPTTTIDDLVYGGPATPTVFGNLTNIFSWKGISLTANITYRLGHYFRKESIDYNALFTMYSGNSDYAMRWEKPGDELVTNVPAMIYPNNKVRDNFYNNSEILVRKADNIRLQFINLAYDIKPRFSQRLSFEKIQLYLIASNLGILWKADKEVVDPEYGSNTVRPAASLTVGFKATF